jgi:hypothetical protein
MYRDHLQAARIRRQRLLESWGSTQPDTAVFQIYRARLRRIWGAAAALAAIALAAVQAIAPAIMGYLFNLSHYPFAGSTHYVADLQQIVPLIFISGWVFALLGGWIAHLAAPRLFIRALRRQLSLGGDLFRDLETLEQRTPSTVARAIVQRHRRLSLALPLIAGILLTPLSLHFIGAAALGATLGGFVTYMCASTILIGHAYVVLILLAVRHVDRCYRDLSAAPAGGPPRNRGWEATGAATAVACVPGLALLGIPPLLVALTGAVFLPPSFDWAARRAWHEELLLEASEVVEASAPADASAGQP